MNKTKQETSKIFISICGKRLKRYYLLQNILRFFVINELNNISFNFNILMLMLSSWKSLVDSHKFVLNIELQFFDQTHILWSGPTPQAWQFHQLSLGWFTHRLYNIRCSTCPVWFGIWKANLVYVWPLSIFISGCKTKMDEARWTLLRWCLFYSHFDEQFLC